MLKVDEDDFRLGDGLDTISKGEVDIVIIAGLGGHTIVEILDTDISKSKSYKRLILQPRKHSGALRHYLYTHGWDIKDEILCKEGKFECEIVTVVPSESEYRDECYPADDIRWKYPKIMVLSNPELAKSRIEWKIGSIDEQIDNLKASRIDRGDQLCQLESDKHYLEDLIKDI